MSKSNNRLNTEKKLEEIVSLSDNAYNPNATTLPSSQLKSRISFKQSLKQPMPIVLKKTTNDASSKSNNAIFNRDSSRDSQILDSSKISSPPIKLNSDTNNIVLPPKLDERPISDTWITDAQTELKNDTKFKFDDKATNMFKSTELPREKNSNSVINSSSMNSSRNITTANNNNNNSNNNNNTGIETYLPINKPYDKTKKGQKDSRGINKNLYVSTPNEIQLIPSSIVSPGSSTSNANLAHMLSNSNNNTTTNNNNNNPIIQRTRINLRSDLSNGERKNSNSVRNSREISPGASFDRHKKTLNLDLNKVQKIVHGHTISAQSNFSNSAHHFDNQSNQQQQPNPNTNTINIFSPSTINYNNVNNLFITSPKAFSQQNKNSKTNNNTSNNNNPIPNPTSTTTNPTQSQSQSQAIATPVAHWNTENNPNPPNTNNSIKKQITHDTKVRSSNIKVVARFRPLNKIEKELMQNGLGNETVVFPDENSVAILPDSQIFTFDKVFNSSSHQEEIYACIGKETIEDVLNGYNGTIFTYGQTSSGKTYTMYGDMHDDQLQGIVPRASKNIFEYISSVDIEVDFVLSCSMLEIYKETLYDLLNPERTIDLKIKESPRRGIYVEGLTQISVVSEDELMEVLDIGERAKTVAATRINQFSSRSHTIFIMEIIQRYTHEAEKSGKLNLVDLAGSEKVGKTGAVGELLEEAKKINLSLSCLGNVIHSLTTSCEHIPYRDSKLTRLLQESLGGNFKTSLIVTCSPHSSNREETISSLKFASRAKCIKNHFKMNIHNSPEAMAAIIEQLRSELEECKIELTKYKAEIFERNRLNLQLNPLSTRRYDDQSNSNPATPLIHSSSPSNLNLLQSNKALNQQFKPNMSKFRPSKSKENNEKDIVNLNNNDPDNVFHKSLDSETLSPVINLELEKADQLSGKYPANIIDNDIQLHDIDSNTNVNRNNILSDDAMDKAINPMYLNPDNNIINDNDNNIKYNQSKNDNQNKGILSTPQHQQQQQKTQRISNTAVGNSAKSQANSNINPFQKPNKISLNLKDPSINTILHNNLQISPTMQNTDMQSQDKMLNAHVSYAIEPNQNDKFDDNILGGLTPIPANMSKSANNATNSGGQGVSAEGNNRKQYNTYTYFKTNLELINQNELLEAKLKGMKRDVENYKSLLIDKDTKLQKQDEEIMQLKNSLMQMENKYNQLLEEKQLTTLDFDTQKENGEHMKLSIQVMENEVNALTEALMNCEQSIQHLLSDKVKKTKEKFLDMLKENLELKEIKLSNYFENSINFNYEPFYTQLQNSENNEKSNNTDNTQLSNSNINNSQSISQDKQSIVNFKESFISNIDLQNAFANASNNLKGMIQLPQASKLLLIQNGYGNIIKESFVDEGQISPELIIYLLKYQLLQSCIINKHLERTIAALEWKQIIEYGKAKIKSNYTLMQEKHVANLEKVLEKAKNSHQQLRNRVEAVELDAIRLRETIMLNMENCRSTNHSGSKARIIKSFAKDFSKKMRKIKEGNELSIQSGRILTENDDIDGSSNIIRSEKAFSFVISQDRKFDSPRADKNHAITQFLKDIEKEQALASGTPNILDEAKIMLNLKNQIIEKLKKFLLDTQFNCGFGDTSSIVGTHYDCYKSEKERLENKIMILQSELDLECTKAEQLKEAYLEANKQIRAIKKLNEEMEIASRNALKLENESWQQIVNEMKDLNEKEMIRKQEELTRLHDLLAGWVFKYMELQELKGIAPTHQEKMLFETFKRKELPDKTLLEKALGGVKLSMRVDHASATTKISKKSSDNSNTQHQQQQSEGGASQNNTIISHNTYVKQQHHQQIYSKLPQKTL